MRQSTDVLSDRPKGRITRFVRPFVCLSVPYKLVSLKSKRGIEQTKIGVNVLHGKSNRCNNF